MHHTNLDSVRRVSGTLLLAACSLLSVAAGAAERGPVVTRTGATSPAAGEAQVIVKYRQDSSVVRALALGTVPSAGGPQFAQAFSTRLGLALSDGAPITSRIQVMRGSGVSSEELARQLSAQSDVEYAVVDGRKYASAVTINDPLYLNAAQAQTPAAGQWYLQAPTATLFSAINAPAAWTVTTGKASVIVADLDTGVRPDHPDLATKLIGGYDFVSSTANANDGDGRDADPSDPGDWVTSAENSAGTFKGCGTSNSSWHGTQTAGLIGAATNNGIGMASIGHDVMVMPVRVLGKCGGADSDIITAIRWAAGLAVSGMTTNPNPARVINMSLGASEACSAAYQDALSEVIAAKVVVVAAAGNEGLAVDSPANCSGVIAVTGVRHTGTKVGYSSLGPLATIAAPAGNCVNATGTCIYPILTTANSGTTTPVAGASGATYTSGGADESLGTSFSTPLVSGTVALMLSANASLTPAQVAAALKATARPFPSTGADAGITACTAPTSVAQNTECYCTTSTCGAGLLDAGKAVASVATATANIAVASSQATAGTAVTLDASGSTPSGGATITGYLWAITSGGSLASFTSSNTAATVTLLPVAAGTVTVSVTVTDSAGHTDTASTSLIVAAAPVVVPPVTVPPTTPTTTTSSSSGGGGAVDAPTLLAALAALLLAWRVRRVDARRGIVRTDG